MTSSKAAAFLRLASSFAGEAGLGKVAGGPNAAPCASFPCGALLLPVPRAGKPYTQQPLKWRASPACSSAFLWLYIPASAPAALSRSPLHASARATNAPSAARSPAAPLACSSFPSFPSRRGSVHTAPLHAQAIPAPAKQSAATASPL